MGCPYFVRTTGKEPFCRRLSDASGSGGGCCPILSSHPAGLQHTIIPHHDESGVRSRSLIPGSCGLHGKLTRRSRAVPDRNGIREGGGRGQTRAAAPRIAAARSLAHACERAHSRRVSHVGEGGQQRALRQLRGAVPAGEDAGQRTDR